MNFGFRNIITPTKLNNTKPLPPCNNLKTRAPYNFCIVITLAIISTTTTPITKEKKKKWEISQSDQSRHDNVGQAVIGHITKKKKKKRRSIGKRNKTKRRVWSYCELLSLLQPSQHQEPLPLDEDRDTEKINPRKHR